MAYSLGSGGWETVEKARLRACRRIAWTAGVTAAVLLLATHVTAVLSLLHTEAGAVELWLGGCLPLAGPLYACTAFAVRGHDLWQPLALLLAPLLLALAAAVVYGLLARRTRRLMQPTTEAPTTEAVVLPPLDESPLPVRSVKLPDPLPVAAVAPTKAAASETTAVSVSTVESEDAELRKALEEYKAAQARIADILKHK